MDKTKVVSIVLAALMVCTASQAWAITVRGSRTCGTWVKDKAENGRALSGDQGTLVGYLSGLAVATNTEILDNLDVDSMSLWVDNYCREHPLDDTYDAGMALFRELKKRMSH